LERSARGSGATESHASRVHHVTNLVIGNNATAVDAAGMEAERRGYSHAMIAARELEGLADEVGRHHAQLAWGMRYEPGPDCLITGGEPTVRLAEPARRGKGGRNQQLVLAALLRLVELHRNAGRESVSSLENPLDGIAILSGGTDGEDGPTDAAGAIGDADVYREMLAAAAMPEDYLTRNDAYHFFERVNGLLKTGPTHTNVCDLRVVVTSR
jgi:glycerate 2-kinase